MEVKQWSYEEFPAYEADTEGAVWIETTGDEMGAVYFNDVEYENINGVSRHLQILLPQSRKHPSPRPGTMATTKYPCVVFVQGSGWFKQHVYAQLPMIAKLAQRGYVVAIVEYREIGIGVFPDPIRDCRNAARFMKAHAEEYGVDVNRMIIAGDSSGGHTAVYAGILHDDDTEYNLFPGISAEVNGIVNFYGATSFIIPDSNPTTVNHNMPDSPEGLEMGGIDLNENREAREKLTVECNIDEHTQIPPVLNIHGTKDRTVNCQCSVDLYKKLKACGKKTYLYLLKGADHGGPEFWTDQMLDIVEAFMKEVFTL